MRNYQQYDGRSYRRSFGFGPGALSSFIKAMIIINVLVLVIQFLYPKLSMALGLTPARFFSDFPNLLYQPFTYMFLHGGLGHIFFNMFALWMFGTEIENGWGSRRFGKFYLLSGLSGAVLTLIVNSSQMNPVVGASAAIYGVLAAYWVMFPNRLLYIWFLFPVKVKWAIPGLMLLGFLFGGAQVAHFAHLGGALFGFLYMKSDWRLPAFSKRFKNLRYQRKAAKLEKNRQKAEDIMKRVDDILDKISEVGIENLTKEERKFLEDASSKLSQEKTRE